MTFDSAFSSLALDTDNRTSTDNSASAPAVKARKARTVKAPTAALFAPIASSAPIRGDYAVTVDRDDDAGLDVTVSTMDAVMRVTYRGPNDRTLVAGLRAKQSSAPVIANAQEWGAAALGASTFRAVTLDASPVSDALAHVIPAMSTDATRYNLSGVYWDAKTGNVVATDGHRLHLFSALESPFNAGVIIPRHAVVALEKAIKATRAAHVIIGAAVDMAVFIVTGENLSVEIRARLVDGQFPDYTQVIPSTDGVPAFTGDADAIRKAIDAAPVIGDKNARRMMVLSTSGSETLRHDGVKVAMPLVPTHSDVLVGAYFNAKYVDQAFAELDGAVSVYLPDDMSPMRIDNGPRMVIIMPMRA